MMAIPRRKNDVGLRRSVGTLSRSFYSLARELSHELVNELGRLNSARIGAAKLSRLGSRDRVRAVKDALAAHHQGSSRCC